MVSSGMKVVSNPNPTVGGPLRHPVDPASEMILEAFLHPGTVLLLAINLAVACYLLLREVRWFRPREEPLGGSPDRSFSLVFFPVVLRRRATPTSSAPDAGFGGGRALCKFR